ncbi:MAG: hypothetical protein WBD62_17140 [Anaerolineales bacterium]|nr:hypothetical protein [Anaerolineales bacterium]
MLTNPSLERTPPRQQAMIGIARDSLAPLDFHSPLLLARGSPVRSPEWLYGLIGVLSNVSL